MLSINPMSCDFTNIEQSAYTQGLGVFYKQSFNNFYELFCELGNLFKAKSKECQTQNKEGSKDSAKKLLSRIFYNQIKRIYF